MRVCVNTICMWFSLLNICCCFIAMSHRVQHCLCRLYSHGQQGWHPGLRHLVVTSHGRADGILHPNISHAWPPSSLCMLSYHNCLRIPLPTQPNSRNRVNLSPLALVPPWVQWLNKLVREMYVLIWRWRFPSSQCNFSTWWYLIWISYLISKNMWKTYASISIFVSPSL